MKNVKRINESQLRAIVAESVKRVLKEGTTDESLNNAWIKAVELMGALYRALGEDEIRANLKFIDRNYKLGLFNDEEEFENEDDL